MISRFSHSVVSKNNQSCLIVHKLHYFLDQVLCIEQLAFNFRVVVVIGVSCAVDADDVAHQ